MVAALGVDAADVRDMAWVDNGPGWLGVDLGEATTVLGLRPDVAALAGLDLTVIGRWDPVSARELGADVEVRALWGDGTSLTEDPVTGSANAGLAQWLIGTAALPASYTARQGSAIGREGRVHLETVDGEVWVSGEAVTRVLGTVDL